MSETPEETTLEVTPNRNSKKREFAATAIAGTVTVVLGLAATAVIEKVSKRVHDQIAPPKKSDTEEE